MTAAPPVTGMQVIIEMLNFCKNDKTSSFFIYIKLEEKKKEKCFSKLSLFLSHLTCCCSSDKRSKVKGEAALLCSRDQITAADMFATCLEGTALSLESVYNAAAVTWYEWVKSFQETVDRMMPGSKVKSAQRSGSGTYPHRQQGFTQIGWNICFVCI